MDLQIRKQTNPVHPLTSSFFCTLPSHFSVKILGACPVPHISYVFQIFIFSLILSPKHYFVKICHPCFLYFWHASGWSSATLPYSTHKSRTIILQNSCFSAGWPWSTHTTNAPKQDVLLAVYFRPQSQIEISVSSCSRAKSSIYVPTELSYWCRKKLHPYQ